MRLRALILTALLSGLVGAVGTPATAETKGKGPAGVWLVSLKFGPVALRLGLELADVSGRLAGTLTSIDQGAAKIKVDSATFADGSLKLTLRQIGGSFEGKLSDDGSALNGTWG